MIYDMIGKNSSIVMCNSVHLKRECNDIECDHSFCKACWSPLAEQYAKDHDLSGGVGGRTRRSRDKRIENQTYFYLFLCNCRL